MTELDEIYIRAKGIWEHEPEVLEREQPLLAKAFAAQGEDQSAQIQLYNRHLAKQEAQIKRLEARLAAQAEEAATRERLLRNELEARELFAGKLVADLLESQKELEWATRKRKTTPDEEDALAEMGLRKGLL